MTTQFHPVLRIMCGAINPLVRSDDVFTGVVLSSGI
jgi:hypothetical protein